MQAGLANSTRENMADATYVYQKLYYMRSSVQAGLANSTRENIADATYVYQICCETYMRSSVQAGLANSTRENMADATSILRCYQAYFVFCCETLTEMSDIFEANDM